MGLSICKSMINEQGMELTEHGTLLFPAAFYHDDLQEEDVAWHWHDELEIFLVSEGATEVTAGSETYVIEAGDGIFINAGILHGARMYGETGCRYHSIVFHSSLIGGSADSIFWQNYLNPLMKDGGSGSVLLRRTELWQRECLELLETAWQSGIGEQPGYEFEVRNALSGIICRLALRRPDQEKKISEKTLREEERMKRMLNYIEEHEGEEITVEQIADSISVSTSECLRCFHHTIGITPMQYVIRRRIRRAADLLSETEKKISEIGMQCGFQDMSYFARMFRQIKGYTPSEYRKLKQNTSGQETTEMIQ